MSAPRIAGGFLAMCFLSLLASAGQKMSAGEFESFVQGYYSRPRPELIAGSIESVEAVGWVQKGNWGYVSFLSEIFLANPACVPEWRKVIFQQNKPAQDFLGHAIDLYQSGGLLAASAHWAPSAQLNDMYWGAFFATGNPTFVRKLIDVLKYADERKDQNLFYAGATAKWSLCGNAETHPVVLETIKQSEKDADRRTGEIIFALLKQNAADVRREIREVVEHQKAVGVWK